METSSLANGGQRAVWKRRLGALLLLSLGALVGATVANNSSVDPAALLVVAWALAGLTSLVASLVAERARKRWLLVSVVLLGTLTTFLVLTAPVTMVEG